MLLESLATRLSTLGILAPSKWLPNTFPAHNVVDVLRTEVATKLLAVSGVDVETIVPALDWPSTMDKGDLILAVPRLRVKGAKPQELAEQWALKLEPSGILGEVKAQGAFLQFFAAPKFLASTVLADVLTREGNYGAMPLVENKKVIVEFSLPNIAKPFHAGHLRLTIIGGFLANLYEKCGWDVTRMNYLGDWGKQFGVLAVGFAKYGLEEELEKDPIHHLFQVYVKINADIEAEGAEVGQEGLINEEARKFFKKMEDGDVQALALWKKFRELSITRYINTYARLNIVYDEYAGELTVPQELMTQATEQFEAKGLVEVDRGAKLIDLTRFNKKLGKVLVQKLDGTSLYLTRDVGGAIDRFNRYHFDRMVYVIALQQDLHTAQFFEILKQMDLPWADRLEHVNFGMVMGMLTRKGTVVFLDDILEETKNKMHEVMKRNEAKYAQIEDPERVADLVGILAVMIQDMQAKRINNYEFKWERMLLFEGDTGPYLQYAHLRMALVLRKATQLDSSHANLAKADLLLLTEDCAVALVRLLAQYPDVIRNAAKTQEPLTVVTYLFKLTHQVSSCYDILWVAGQEEALATARLALYESARQVLNNGMRLLGLTPVDRM